MSEVSEVAANPNTVELSGGHSASLKPVDLLKASDRLAVHGEIALETVNGKVKMTMALAEELKVATIVHVIESWTRPEKVAIESVVDLTMKDYNKLVAATKEHMKALGVGAADKSEA